MRIGLVDVDGRGFPNLVLMKLAAWHKARGDTVEFADPEAGRYDKVYMSKVFTHSPDCRDEYPCEVVRGGTGYRDYATVLPEEVEHTCPDYSLYGVGEAYGFLTRGCPNRCPWCVVPRKEGGIRPHADIEEFLAGRRRAVLLDNNVLASDWGLVQIGKIVRLGIRVDFNQGLDARRIARDPEVAELLARVRWLRFLRMAYDTNALRDDVHRAVELLGRCGIPPRKLFFYVLVRDDIDEALRRIRELKALGCVPFAQPYRDFTGGTKPSREAWRLAYWCNNKRLFNAMDFALHMQINVMRYEKSDFRGSGRTQRQEVRRTGDDPRTDSLQEDTRSRPGARFNGSTSIRHTVIREVAGVSLKDEKTMIKCNVTVCGTIGREAASRTGKEGKTFLSFPLRVAIQGKDGQSETVEIGVSRDGGQDEAAGYRKGSRIEATGTMYLKRRGERLYFNLFADRIVPAAADAADAIEGEMSFRGKAGKNIEERKDKNGKPYTVFSAFSAEKTEDGFEYQWVRFLCFDRGREEWLQPGARVEVKGAMSVAVHNGKPDLSCRAEELAPYVAEPDNANR